MPRGQLEVARKSGQSDLSVSSLRWSVCLINDSCTRDYENPLQREGESEKLTMPNSVCLKSSPPFQSFILPEFAKCAVQRKEAIVPFFLTQFARKWSQPSRSGCSSFLASSDPGKRRWRKQSSRKCQTTLASLKTTSGTVKRANLSSGVVSTRCALPLLVSPQFPSNSPTDVDFLKRQGTNVVLDRQNFDKAQRKVWLGIANEFPNLVVSGMAMGTPYSVSPALLHSYGGD